MRAAEDRNVRCGVGHDRLGVDRAYAESAGVETGQVGGRAEANIVRGDIRAVDRDQRVRLGKYGLIAVKAASALFGNFQRKIVSEAGMRARRDTGIALHRQAKVYIRGGPVESDQVPLDWEGLVAAGELNAQQVVMA